MTVVDVFTNIGIVAGAVVALSTAIIMTLRKLNQFGSWLHHVNQVVTRELTHNGGLSMKDQLTAVRVEQLRLQNTVDDHLSDVAAHASDPTAHLRPSFPDGGGAGPR